MKRKISIFIGLLILAGGFSSCKKTDDNEFVKMSILPEEITENSINKLRIENHTKKDIIYGASFSLEYFNENNWELISLDLNWEDIGYILKAGSTTEGQVNLCSLVQEYNNGKKGKYRIIKEVNSHFEQQNFILCAEFEIK